MQNALYDSNNNYRIPFLWMHGEDIPRLRQVIGAIHDSGIGALCVESRPHPDFLGQKWWQDMDVVLENAKSAAWQCGFWTTSAFPRDMRREKRKTANIACNISGKCMRILQGHRRVLPSC